MALFNYECDEVKRKIEEVSPNYPQLTTYEKEWLYFHKYGYVPGIPVELECETVSVNPTGSVSNAIPFKYKSAILKGQTLNNLISPLAEPQGDFREQITINGLDSSTSSPQYRIRVGVPTYPLSKGKTYLIYFELLSENGNNNNINNRINMYGMSETNTEYFTIPKPTLGVNMFTFTPMDNFDKIGLYINKGIDYQATISKMMIIEYQEGMENWDIPYFEGMKSVQMPVLTTVGKNLFDGVSYIDGFVATGNDYTVSYDTNVVSILANVNKNTDYILSAKTTFDRSLVGGSLEPISIGTKTTNLNAERVANTVKFNSGEFTNIIIYLNSSKIDIEDIQLEEGTVATTYEPYKSNILTVNEEVELRGVGNVKDELNLLTGKLTQRIDEVILNGSEDWVLSSHGNSTMFYTSFNNLVHKGYYMNSISCDKFVVHDNESYLFSSTSPNGISAYADLPNTYPNENWLYIKHADSEGSVEKFKQWLSQNPITVQYELATESVKTVALTPLNKPYDGTNHYELTSNIPCEAILEVPVVSTGKQTLVEINN